MLRSLVLLLTCIQIQWYPKVIKLLTLQESMENFNPIQPVFISHTFKHPVELMTVGLTVGYYCSSATAS